MDANGPAGLTPAQPELLERDDELGRIDEALDSALAGTGAVLLLEGEAGIGKTTLLRAGAARAAARGLRVLSGRGGELEHEFAYGLARQLLERELSTSDEQRRARLLSGAAGLALPAIAPAANGDAPPAPPPPEAFAVQHGLYWLLSNLAEEQPLALVIDDLHWSDGATQRFLIYLARRLEGLPIALLGAVRLPEGGSPTGLLATLRADAQVTSTELGPLGEPSVGRLAAGVYAREADGRFVHACYEVTGGNPFLATELLGALAADAIEPTAAEAGKVSEVGPVAVSSSVLLRLARLPGDALALAEAVAVLGSGAQPRHAGALAGLAPARVLPAADALVEARILAPGRPLEFLHPLVRTAVYGSLPSGRRAGDHGRAARLLADDGADGDHVAGQLLLAEPAADAWVVAALQRAAADALGRGAPDAAVEYLRRSLAEPPPESARAAVAHRLGSARFLAGDAGGIEQLRAALVLSADPGERALISVELGLLLTVTEQGTEAVAVLGDAIAALPRGDPLADALEAVLIHTLQFDIETSRLLDEHITDDLAELAGDTPEERLVLATLAFREVVKGDSATRAGELAQRAVARGLLFDDQPTDVLLPLYAVFALIASDHHDAAATAIEQFMVRARERGSLLGYGSAAGLRCDLNLRLGRLDEALTDARIQVDAIRTMQLPELAALDPLLEVLVRRGDLDDAEDELRAAAIDDQHHLANNSIFSMTFLHGRGVLRIAQGDLRAGVDDLLECGRRCLRWGRDPRFPEWRADAALALFRLGDAEQAFALAREEVEAGSRFGAPRQHALALRALAVVEGGERGIELLREAAAMLEPTPAQLAKAEVLVELGSALRRSGQRAAAREPLQRGHELATRCEAAPVAERARAELQAAGSRPRKVVRSGVDALTPSERRVCGLAAQGRTNPEIANALFVTRATVESHLHSAYRKLGLSSRADLGPLLAKEVQ